MTPEHPAGTAPRHGPEWRAEALAAADADALVALAEACLDRYGEPTVLVRPEIGLVMVQVREPVCEERFHLGEVVVTRAEVALGDGRGWAVRPGTDRVATLAAAICDAVADAAGELADDVVELCDRTLRRAARGDAGEWAELRATEVHFEELD